ncbi:LacI family DNA-binding transcriptional regulator [uncultured Roseobacter sp.]|uniref:LacI family DNA-binding transcriptional regulator n=1 Tax=uncultured Roseobacter sp. TaxID=114847 RepID=UPI00260C6D82|nr:LacI family DNA-binding transcriptional regulator [uncultured Roseobacter sp.]
MTAPVTMRDVAREVGVSPMTVSRALRGDGTVSQKTRDTIRAAADRLGYVYDTTAQAFRAQKSGFVAVTLPSIDNANFAATHRGLTEVLSETGLQILLGSTNYSVDAEERIVRQLLERKPEAIILTGGHHSPGTRALLRARDIPVVEMWDLPEAPLQHTVGFSNPDAMTGIVEQLAASGRRRLAFLGAEGESDRRGAERCRGVIGAAQRLGLPTVEVLSIGPAPVSMSEGAQAVADMADRLPEFDALVCVSDTVAFGALTACQRRGVSVPGDIAITGFGAFEIAAVSCPALTTVDVFAYDIGVAAGGLITNVLADPAGKDAVVVETAVQIRPGETS